MISDLIRRWNAGGYPFHGRHRKYELAGELDPGVS